jgi:uncharacterized protein (TIGR00251 family)
MKLQIKIKPHSGKSEIIGENGNYVVHLKSLPENNKANLELIKLLKKYFRGKEVKIKSGFTSRNKIIEVED